jgi:Lipocalin-like domain
MRPFLSPLLLLLLVPAIGQENGFAQSKADLVGTWKLISVTDTTDKGQVIHNVYGVNPPGLLTYTADGRMMAIITNGGRKPLSVPDRVLAPASERADAFRPRLPMVHDTLSTATK